MEVTASSAGDLDETRVWFGSGRGVRGERLHLHRLREKALCMGGLKRKETASDDTENGGTPEKMSSEVHTNDETFSMHFKIAEIHKQRMNSVLYTSHNYKQLLLYKYPANDVVFSLSLNGYSSHQSPYVTVILPWLSSVFRQNIMCNTVQKFGVSIYIYIFIIVITVI